MAVWNTEKDELLPQSSVIAMTQTRDGYRWLGTMKGLVGFDGSKAEVFDPLGSATIIYLFEDSRGGLWAGTEKNGVALIRGGGMTNVVAGGGPGGRLVSACEDASGAVWLCTADGRVSRFRNGARENDWELDDFKIGGFRAIVTERSGQLLVASAGRLSRVTSDVHASPFSLELQRTTLSGELGFPLLVRPSYVLGGCKA